MVVTCQLISSSCVNNMHVCGIRFNAERAEKKLKSHYPNISVSSMTPNQLCTSVLFLKIEHYSDVALKSIFFFVSINFATNTLKIDLLCIRKFLQPS